MIETRDLSLFDIRSGRYQKQLKIYPHSRPLMTAPTSRGNMSFGYKVSAWLVEMLAEAAVFPLILLAMFTDRPPITAAGIGALTMETLTFFFISGYAVTTAVVRFALPVRWSNAYPVIAPLLLLMHFEVMNLLVSDGLFDLHDRLVFRVVGSGTTLVITTAIAFFLKHLATNRPATSGEHGKEAVDAN